MGFFKALNDGRKAFSYSLNGTIKLGGEYILPVGYHGFDKDFTNKTALEYFTTIPEVNIILNYRARAFSNMKLEAINKTTGEPYTGNKNLTRILKQPNFFQGIGELTRQSSLFHDIHGNEYSYFLAPLGLEKNIKAWYTIPPALLKVQPALKTPYIFETESPDIKYTMIWDNEEYPIEQSQIIHINDNRVNVDEKNWIKGESKLRALQIPCENLSAAYEARNVSIVNHGPAGMITPDNSDALGSTPFTPEQKKEVQTDFAQYGMSKKQWQYLISRVGLKYTQMGIDTNKLQLFTEVENDTIKICDAYGFPYRLLANIKTGNLGGSDIADLQKVWYLNSIIPETMEKVGVLNNFFNTEKESWHIVANYDHLHFFATDQKEKASTIQIMVNSLSTAYADEAITLDEYRQILQDNGITSGKAKGNKKADGSKAESD